MALIDTPGGRVKQHQAVISCLNYCLRKPQVSAAALQVLGKTE